jgi:Asp-tRNA(Asn)/Glu-tRNA(Gln) amidotransferase A subunit family amidase
VLSKTSSLALKTSRPNFEHGTNPVANPPRGELLDLPAVSGYLHVTVRGGQYRGLPIVLSFLGRPFSEGKLIGYAVAARCCTTSCASTNQPPAPEGRDPASE